MWTIEGILALLSDVTAKIGRLSVEFDVSERAGGFLLQAVCIDTDAETGRETVWGGRKWYISKHSTRSEILQTCLKATITAAEHEVRERFLYCGRQVFGPHIDVDALWTVANRREVRDG